MITINTQQEFDALIKYGKDSYVIVDDDLTITCNIATDANIKVLNIDAHNIIARNIDAQNIIAWDIDAWNIDACDIDANNITAHNIDARNIDARNIDAHSIKYYAVCLAHNDIYCASISGWQKNCKHFCLDGKITIKNEGKNETTNQI